MNTVTTTLKLLVPTCNYGNVTIDTSVTTSGEESVEELQAQVRKQVIKELTTLRSELEELPNSVFEKMDVR